MSSATSSESTEGPRNRTQQPMLASQREKRTPRDLPGPPTGHVPVKTTGFFPLGYKEGFSQWWAGITPAAAEHQVLGHIPFLKKPPTHTQTGTSTLPSSQSDVTFDANPANDATPVRTEAGPDPYGPRVWHSKMVALTGKDRALNEFSVERENETVEDNLVILHGYGAGLGFFYKNFEGISRVQGWKVYALDMLGMGRSTRPPFKVAAKDPQGKIKEAENWFIDALEEWRKLRKIEKFTLLGHSMGGYMAVAYALKYPGHLKKLILASPVGIPEDPYAVNAEMPDEPQESTLANEFLQDQEDDIVSKNANSADNNNFLNARSKAEADKKSDAPPRRPIPKWLSYLWDANVSPFSIVRWSGPLGPRFVSGWTSRRFSHLPPEEAESLHTYSYSLFRQRGSGEYALAYILAPGAFARSPLIRRIGGVGRQPLPENGTGPLKETGIPVVLMYGENDWMDVKGGYAAVEKLQEEKAKATASLDAEGKKNDQGDAKVLIVKKAGHHVYLDGYDEFNEMIRKELEDTKTQGKKQNGKL